LVEEKMKELIKVEEQIPDEILQRCKNGDSSAFREVVKKYQKYTFILAFKILLNEDDAKDIVQESFIRIWKYFSLFNNQIKFTTWLYKIVINLCYDKMKSIKRREKIMTNKFDLDELLVSSDENPEIEFGNMQLAGIIENLSKDLSYKQRMVFVLRDLQDFSIAEVSALLNISLSSVKTNLVYARRNIKKRLEKYLK
jgi:RNA polymerase sigma-70 factor (ECF subfamily)